MNEPLQAGELFRDLPDARAEERMTPLLEIHGLRFERIVSRGQCSPDGFWYDQEQDEWILLLRGAARLQIEQENAERHLEPGHWMHLPAHCRHRVTWTDPDVDSVWLAVHIHPESSKPQSPPHRRRSP